MDIDLDKGARGPLAGLSNIYRAAKARTTKSTCQVTGHGDRRLRAP